MKLKTNRKKGISYNLMSKYRNELFGISIISIMLFHYFEVSLDKGVLPKLSYAYLIVIDRVGVPVFLILSGMGLFFSMMKDKNVGRFYVRRMVRLLIPYFIISIIAFVVLDFVMSGKTVSNFLSDLFFLNGNHQFWFVALIFFMYLLFPLLFKVFESGKYSFLKMVVLIAVSVGINLLISKLIPSVYAKAEIGLTRVPSFIIGVYLGRKVYYKENVNWSFWVISVLCVAFCFVSRLYLSDVFVRYSQNLYAVPFVILIPLLLDTISFKKLNRLFAFFGAMSLELYMVHVALRAIMRNGGIAVENPLYYFVMLALSVLICYFLQKLDSLLTKKIVSKIIRS